MSEHEKNNPEEKHDFPEEEYLFIDEEPDSASFNVSPSPASSSKSTESSASQEPKKRISLPDFSKLLEKIKLKPVLDLLQQNFALRIGLIVMVVLLLVGIIYRCSSDPLAEKVTEKPSSIPVSHVPAKPKEIIVSTVPSMAMHSSLQTQRTAPVAHPEHVARLEKSNADLQSQIQDLSSQISNLRNNVDTTTASLKVVAEQLSQIAETVSNQAKVNANLAELIKQQHTHPLTSGKPEMPVQQMQCALQAIIPGRAWLLCSNGDTITVSQGTRITDYGVVRYIDATNGRVLTSSGQTITFSQDDS